MTTADLQRAAQALARARERIVALERARAEPVALVGVGLRLPGGVDTPDALWSVLADRRDLTGPVPDDRRAALAGIDAGGPGASRGAWISDVDRFDAARFGVAAREADAMDPQQRLLLEVSLAATERAGLRDDELRGSRTGVYVGICNNDYAQRFLRDPTDPRIDATLGTGNCCSMAAGRISYAFGLTGPAFALDAACASSLLAVHLAVRAIRDGECERALAGGVNLVLSPNPSLAFARMGVLSPTGRCRAMDAAADGYLRADGCVMLVLEPLAAAQAAGRPILAVIRGSAVRQNGTGNGLVAPNPAAQVEVLHAALRDAAVAPADVGLIAAFAAGTPLGDLAEVTALERVFAGRDERRPLWLAPCKPNLGHAEGASGATSLLLACEAIARGAVPPSLLAEGPSPRLPWAATRLADRIVAWDDVDRVAGVSAFGFNGTNVHVVLAAPPPAPAVAVDPPRRISLSARSEPLLRAWAGALAEHLRAHPGLPHAAVLATLTRGRAREPIAAEISADDPATLLTSLDRLAAGEPFTPATDDPSHVPGAMVPLPPRPLARRRHWAELRADDDRRAAPSLPDVALLQAAPRAPRQAAIARAVTRFFAAALRRDVAADDDLGGAGVDSLLAVDLLARVRQDWGLVVFPGELFARRTAAGLAEHFAALLDPPDVAAAASHADIRRALAAGHRRGRPPPAVDEPPADASLAAPVFLLSTPRSGSTLLRALLGAHPALFAPPELHLLAYADVADWRDALAPDLLHLGLHQALAGLGLTDEQLLARVAAWADARAPISAVYDELRARAAPRRLIDKSPSYALDADTLARAARLFPRARYIHLVRHPVPTCRSFVERRMGRLLGLDGLDASAAAAAVWNLGNHHLLEFLAARPADHVLQVRYEALVRDPAAELARVCRFLDLEFTPAMLDPHARRFPGEDRGVIGDPGFYARRGIDPGLADEWRARPADDDLSPETAALAARLGYAIDGPAPAELAEIRLDPAIAPAPRRVPRPPRRLLLTGATGFLGPWLIRALRARGPAEIVALVRARDDAEAARRLRAALAAIPDVDPTDIRAVAGHLDRPRLGLDDATWSGLADVDLVVHNGAEVNFTRTWQQLAASNIGGTAEALRLACAGRAGFVHVSTKGVFDPAVYPGDAEIREDDPVRAPEGPLLGYQRSKWAAEALVHQAGARGLPVVVARPGRIGGDLATGAVPDTDFMVVFLRGCAEVAALPDLAHAIELSPVDVVAAAIAGLCTHEAPFGRAYHLTHPAPIDLRSVAAIAGELGVRLDVLPYPAWRARLLARAGGPGSALAPLLSMFPAHEPARIDDRRLAHANLAAVVPDVAWPPMPALLRTSLENMRRRGLL